MATMSVWRGAMIATAIAVASPLYTQAPQRSRQVEAMTIELCGCMSSIALSLPDRAFDQRVRRCLEDAVVHHPTAVRSLIRAQEGDDSKGYQIGLILGRELGKGCKAFGPIQDRLRVINAASPLIKSTS